MRWAVLLVCFCCFFFFKQKTAYEIMPSLVGSEMCIRDRPPWPSMGGLQPGHGNRLSGVQKFEPDAAVGSGKKFARPDRGDSFIRNGLCSWQRPAIGGPGDQAARGGNCSEFPRGVRLRNRRRVGPGRYGGCL